MSGSGEATGRAFARAALLGNPSDAYGGKTIAVTIRDYAAEVTVSEADELRTAGVQGGGELVAAAVARFETVCRERGAEPRSISVGLRTTIPVQVGLGGSSAIVIATLRALCELNELEIEPARMAELALAVEVEELGIAAGLQDRVVQSYEGLVYMDFSAAEPHRYERLDPALLPPLFVAHRAGASQPSGLIHAGLRERFERGDRATVAAIERIARLAESGRRCLLDGDREALGQLMAENVAARAELVELDPRHLRMIELSRSLGAPANYAGSGGAIVGLVPARLDRDELRDAFTAEGCELVFPA